MRRRHLDVMQADDRVDNELADVEALADDLAVDLALGRDVDEDVAADLGRAGQPPVRRKTLLLAVGRLEDSERRQVSGLGDDPVLRELAETLGHLAAAADAAPATHGVDVHAERARRVEDRRPRREPTATAGRGEDDERVVSHVSQGTVARRYPTAATARRLMRRRLTSPSGTGTRWAVIHRPQSGSWPIRTSAAMTDALTSGISGFVIAEVIPAAMAIGRNAPLMPSRFGRPKLTFDAPQVVLTRSSSRRRRTSWKTCWPACDSAPMGMTSGSTTMSERGMPWSAARSTIRFATANRTSGSIEIPVSSLLMATPAAPYLRTSGRTRSRRSSSPVTELSSGFPRETARPAPRASAID